MSFSAPVANISRRRLRVLICARYSTDEQRASSIDDQIAFCKHYLERYGFTDIEIEVRWDKELSGELRNRPGIDQVWAGIDKEKWDLIVCEDSSRLYRKETFTLEIVENAYDNDMRVICINDDVDTDVPGWRKKLRESARQHEECNEYTRLRIHRAFEGLWGRGAAIGKLRTGYRRRPSAPATLRQPEQGPFFDDVDPVWAPFVEDAFRRVADKVALWLVAKYLTDNHVPKCGRVLNEAWTEADVIRLIRRTIYRGLDIHRREITTQKLRTGVKRVQQNKPDEIWQRDMPHLRIVTDALWSQANAAIDERTKVKTRAKGKDHPLYGIPRDSRGPLSNLFVCGVESAVEGRHKMRIDRRNGGGFGCSLVHNGLCWNKATALRDLTYRALSRAISEKLLAMTGSVDSMVEFVQFSLSDAALREERGRTLRAEASE